MKVSKWGNSLAIRLSAETVQHLGLREGDDVEVRGGLHEGAVEIRRKRTKEELRARLAEIRKTVQIPADYKFNRDEANSRDE